MEIILTYVMYQDFTVIWFVVSDFIFFFFCILFYDAHTYASINHFAIK
jgi:hypothetical protein